MLWKWLILTSFLALQIGPSVNTTDLINNTVSSDAPLPFYCVYCYCKNTTDGIISNCSGKGLFHPPRNIDNRTIALYLSRNLIKTVKYSGLKGLYNLEILDLSENTISRIEDGAFQDLRNLTHLFLNGQISSGLFILQRVFSPGVFIGLTSLKVLHIHKCLGMVEAYTSVIPTDALTALTSLEELRIDGVANATFSEDFRQLKHLSIVIMSGYDGECIIGHLDRHSFVGLENLKTLSVNKCRIISIKKGTFWYTQKLEYLDISWNTELEIYNFGKILEELKYTSLRILKISAIHNPTRAGTEILRPNVRYLRDIKLTDVYMDDNGIEFVDYGVFEMFPKTLKRIYLRRNKLNFGLYMYEAIFNNPNLEILDVGDQEVATRAELSSRNPFKDLDTRQRRAVEMSNMMDDVGGKISSGPTLHLKTLICTGSVSRLIPIDFNGTINNLTFMDLSRNFIPKIKPNAFLGLDSLQHLNLSSNYIEKVRENAFNGLHSVQILDLKNNLLGFLLEHDENGHLLSPLASLKDVNLSRNRITALAKDVFKNVKYLEQLDLSDNYIENLNVDISSLSNLKFIDLRFNRLQSLPVGVTKHLDTISKQHPVSIDLSDNKLLCTCNSIVFIRWLVHSKVEFLNIDKYYCAFENTTIRVFNESRKEILAQLEKDCKSYLGIIVGSSTSSGIILAFLISYMVYTYRWKLRYIYYMAKIKFDGHSVDVIHSRTQSHYLYDVFISYGDGDRDFVVGDMRDNLENAAGKKLNIRDRDFELGEVIAVNISKAIRSSKKTFLLLSRHFLRNKWCNFEMNMARMEAVHMKREVIVIIFLETIPVKLLPLELMDLLRECPNTDLPKDSPMRAAFWQKCVDYINS